MSAIGFWVVVCILVIKARISRAFRTMFCWHSISTAAADGVEVGAVGPLATVKCNQINGLFVKEYL